MPSQVLLEVPKCLLVVLDGLLLGWFGKSERCLATCVADGAIGSESFLEHPQEHRDGTVHVIIKSGLRSWPDDVDEAHCTGSTCPSRKPASQEKECRAWRRRNPRQCSDPSPGRAALPNPESTRVGRRKRLRSLAVIPPCSTTRCRTNPRSCSAKYSR